MDFDSTNDVGMGPTVRTIGLTWRLVRRQNDDLDIAVIEAVREIDGQVAIFDVPKKPFDLHLGLHAISFVWSEGLGDFRA